jgi:hypothetical protein
MPDDPTVNDDPEGGDTGSGLRKQLEEALAENRQLKEQAAQRARDEAMAAAGVPEAAKFFRHGYDGDLTPEAIRLAAEAEGIVAPKVEEPVVPPAEAAALGRIDEAGGGAPPPTDSDASFQRQLAEAKAAGDEAKARELIAAAGGFRDE